MRISDWNSDVCSSDLLSPESRSRQRHSGRCAGAVLTVDIRTIAETGSTNADLLSLAGQQAIAEGFWLRAERQSGGRGRLARRWESPAGTLYCWTLVQLRPHDPPPGDRKRTRLNSSP